MKKECSHTRKMLPRYLHGHLFKFEQVRIERHLRSCVVCYSQYQALKRADETQRLLKDITPPEGMVQIVRERASKIGKLKKLFYRPLWIVAILTIVALLIYYLQRPRQLDIELDAIAKNEQTKSAQTVTAKPAPEARPVSPVRIESRSPAAPSGEPLIVTITPHDKAAVRRINEVMRTQDTMRKFKFTELVREISGNLTPKELKTFFARIQPVANATYDREYFESFRTAQPMPFVIKLAAVPVAQEPSVKQQPASEASEVSAASVSAPTSTH